MISNNNEINNKVDKKKKKKDKKKKDNKESKKHQEGSTSQQKVEAEVNNKDVYDYKSDDDSEEEKVVNNNNKGIEEEKGVSSKKKKKKKEVEKLKEQEMIKEKKEKEQRKKSMTVSEEEEEEENNDDNNDNSKKIMSGSTQNADNHTITNNNNSSNIDMNVTNDDNIDKPNFYSENTFDILPLSDKTRMAIQSMKYKRMTQIQNKSIPSALAGKDIIGAAKTGSGKTLAFVIPCIELLYKTKYTNAQGTGIIIISPTRELAMQIYGVVQEIYEYGKHPQTYGLLMGGANRRTEADKLIKGINLIVCTPGRLLDHLQNTKGFIYRNLLTLVMDEADRILEQGFEDDLRAILKILPSQRQTMLFSATQTKKVEDLVRLSIDTKNSIFVDIPTETQLATAAGLEQGYVTCPSEQRFLLLFTFLKKNRKKKIMVFFSSCNSVKYHSELLNYIDIPVMDIHGKQKQVKRTTTFFTFCKASTGTLLCTDVAARGLDIPDVDWIIQYDPPDDPKEYIHRVGRTARGATGKGRALLFLTPQEIGFLKYLKAAKVTLNEYEFPVSKIANVQSQLFRLIESNYYLNRTARDAYRSYILAYASHSLRDIYNVHELDLQGVATAFGFTTPPRVDILSILGNKSKDNAGRKRKQSDNSFGGTNKKNVYQTSGHAFSASNPYGKRESNDKRQFTH